MAIVTLGEDSLRKLEKFSVTCKKCGSNNCAIEIDWAAYPSASWNNIEIICKDCHEDETVYES